MAEFLLELFSEEIPARMQEKAANDLKDLITKGLTEKGLTFSKAEAHSTPRRLALVVDGLPLENNPPPIDKKGPRIDAAQQALDGFLKSIGQSDFSKCVQEETPKGTFWFYREAVKAQETRYILDDLVSDALLNFSWPKSMKWKSYSFNWVRPLQSITAIFDGATLTGDFNIVNLMDSSGKPLSKEEIEISTFRLQYTHTTKGHRFLVKDGETEVKEFEVANFADYKQKLKDHKVLLSREERKASIIEQAQKLAAKESLKVREDDALVDEIIGLVEWPVALLGTFEKEYLEVPQEVLISTMRGNQKYLALVDDKGKLSNKFVVIANTETEDGGKQVIAGNEKVLRARLSDAKFYWDQDRRQKLASRVDALKAVTFHQKLGTVYDKVKRLEQLSAFIAKQIGANEADAARAALLAKADLTAGVVFQFPEVQGIIGRYYALHDKEKDDVASAIADHYKPVGASDSCPTLPVSIAVALADKFDTLVGFFAIDEKPTGSKDPYALRRATLGIIRIILENRLKLNLSGLIKEAYAGYVVKGLRPYDDVKTDLLQFFADRLKVALKDQGARFDLIDAVLGNKDEDDLCRIVTRVEILKDFLATEDGANLLTAYKRAANIVAIEEKKDKKTYKDGFNDVLLKEDAEKQLSIALSVALKDIHAALDEGEPNYKKAVTIMATLRKPLDGFFENILVNAPEAEVRENRLRMLSYIRTVMNLVADFSKIEG